MDIINMAERALYGSPETINLQQIKSLRVSFSDMPESKSENGVKLMAEIVRRIDGLEPNSWGARWRRITRPYS